jgi:hypothetical protein
MGTFGTLVGWTETVINWIKKGVRRGQVSNIDVAVSDHDDKRVNDIVRGIEKNREKRTNAS